MNLRVVAFTLLGLGSVLLLGAGCGRSEGRVLGRAPKGSVHTILAVQAGETPQQVTVQGRLVEKCPVAGCWFRVADSSGLIKVDTKAAGFVVTDLSLGTPVTVAGRVVWEGDRAALEATGLRY